MFESLKAATQKLSKGSPRSARPVAEPEVVPVASIAPIEPPRAADDPKVVEAQARVTAGEVECRAAVDAIAAAVAGREAALDAVAAEETPESKAAFESADRNLEIVKRRSELSARQLASLRDAYSVVVNDARERRQAWWVDNGATTEGIEDLLQAIVPDALTLLDSADAISRKIRSIETLSRNAFGQAQRESSAEGWSLSIPTVYQGEGEVVALLVGVLAQRNAHLDRTRSAAGEMVKMPDTRIFTAIEDALVEGR